MKMSNEIHLYCIFMAIVVITVENTWKKGTLYELHTI